MSELVSEAVRHGGGVTGFGMWAGAGTGTVTVEDENDRDYGICRSWCWRE
ncbi:hypothetical protein [Streptomyces sp. NPDC053069]